MIKKMRVNLYQHVRSQDGSPVLPTGEYEVVSLKWISKAVDAANGMATFIVATGPHANDIIRRVGVVRIFTN